MRGQSSPVCSPLHACGVGERVELSCVLPSTFPAFLLQTWCNIGAGSKHVMTQAHLSLSCTVQHLSGRLLPRAGQDRSGASRPHSSHLTSTDCFLSWHDFGISHSPPYCISCLQQLFFSRSTQLLSDSGKTRKARENENWSELFLLSCSHYRNTK